MTALHPIQLRIAYRTEISNFFWEPLLKDNIYFWKRGVNWNESFEYLLYCLTCIKRHLNVLYARYLTILHMVSSDF